MMRSPRYNYSKVVELFQTYFSVDRINSIARDTGFMKRFRKLDGYHFLMLLLSLPDGMRSSLCQMNTRLRAMGIEMSIESLNERFNEASVIFLQSLFEELLSVKLQLNKYKYLSQFDGIYLQDSTAFQLPDNLEYLYQGYGGGATRSAIKLDLTFNYQNNDQVEIKICSGTSVDINQTMKEYKPGSLILRDMGYFKIDELQRMHESTALYITRLRSDIKVFEHIDSTAPIDLLKKARNMKVHEIKTMTVYIGKKKIATRLVFKKLSKSEADSIRVKLKTDKVNKKKNLTERRLDLCQIRPFLTNLPQELITDKQVMELYRLRWQIELIFKSWKSIFRLDKVKGMKGHRFQTTLFANLIRILLNFKILGWAKANIHRYEGKEISELKAIQSIETTINLWANLFLKNSKAHLIRILKLIIKTISKICLKQPKKMSFTPTKISLT